MFKIQLYHKYIFEYDLMHAIANILKTQFFYKLEFDLRSPKVT